VNVVYRYRDGSTVDRSTQYAMNGGTDPARTEWSGNGLDGKRAGLKMHGALMHRYADNHVIYVEDLYDANGAPVASNWVDCGPMPVEAAAPAPAPARAPAPAPVQFLVDRCTPENNAGEDWWLAFDEIHFVAEFTPGSQAYPNNNKRYGPYSSANGVANIVVGSDQMKMTMQEDAAGQGTVLRWSVDSTHQGSMHCVPFSSIKPLWWDEPPASDRPVVAQAPNGIDGVPLTLIDGAMHVVVALGDRSVDMVLDTGAVISGISTTLANQLIASGQATEAEPHKFILANGEAEMERMIVVHSLTIGSHTTTNALVSVSDNGMSLLGLSVLNNIGPFKIDAVNGKLTFS
jgi:hypothetical protein